MHFWRVPMAMILLLAGLFFLPSPSTAQEPQELPADLAAMPLPPWELPNPGYQFARGGYLSLADVVYLMGERYAPEAESLESLVGAASWKQGYTATFVLLSDRAYRASDPVIGVTTTIHAFASDEGAEFMEALMSSAIPDNAEARDSEIDGATTWRIVTSQEDALVTVVRSGRFVLELVTADHSGTPDVDEHERGVRQTLDRIERVEAANETALSHQMVLVEERRLIPLGIEAESPLVHTWYRMQDGEVIPAAGELEAPELERTATGVTDIVVARQTAELASQSWVTVGVVVASFRSSASAETFADDGALRDPLDIFAVTEDSSRGQPGSEGIRVEALTGETRVGGRYSGFRITVVENATVSQVVIRSMGSVLIDQEAAETWALLQEACIAGGSCDDVLLTELLSAFDPATPVADQATSGEYTSPVAGWSVSFDPEVWQVDDTFAEGGYDYLYLRSKQMDATFETIVDHHGDPAECVLDELDRLQESEERAAITIGSDDGSEAPAGLTDGHAWAIYTIEPLEESRADQEYTIRIDCYTVLEGSISLVVQVRAPRDAWAGVAPLGEALRSQIELDGRRSGGMTRGLLALAPNTRSDVMINRHPWTGIAA